MSRFKVGQTVWFYCNPDNLYNPLEEGYVFEGVIVEIKEEVTTKNTLGNETKESNIKYEVEIGWESYHPKEEEMFETEKEAKSMLHKL